MKVLGFPRLDAHSAAITLIRLLLACTSPCLVLTVVLGEQKVKNLHQIANNTWVERKKFPEHENDVIKILYLELFQFRRRNGFLLTPTVLKTCAGSSILLSKSFINLYLGFNFYIYAFQNVEFVHDAGFRLFYYCQDHCVSSCLNLSWEIKSASLSSLAIFLKRE